MNTLAVLLSPFLRHSGQPGFLARLRRRLRRAWLLHFCLIFSLLGLPQTRPLHAEGYGAGSGDPRGVRLYAGTESAVLISMSAPDGASGFNPGADCAVSVHADHWSRDLYLWSVSHALEYENEQTVPAAYEPLSFGVEWGDGSFAGADMDTDGSGNASAVFQMGTTDSQVSASISGAFGTLTFSPAPEEWIPLYDQAYISASLSSPGSTDNVLPGDTRQVDVQVLLTTWTVYYSTYDNSRTKEDNFSTTNATGAQVWWSVSNDDSSVLNIPPDSSQATTPTTDGIASTSFTIGSNPSVVRADVDFASSASSYAELWFTPDLSEHWQQAGEGHRINGLFLSVAGGQGSLLPGDARDLTANVTYDAFEIWVSDWGNSEEREHHTVAAPEETVSFSVTSGDGALSSNGVITDANGDAPTTFTVNSTDSRVQAQVGDPAADGLTATIDFGLEPEVWTAAGTKFYTTGLGLSASKDSDLYPQESGSVYASVYGDFFEMQTGNYGGYRETYLGSACPDNLEVTFTVDSGDIQLGASGGTTNPDGFASLDFVMGYSDSIIRATTPDGTYATIPLSAHVPIYGTVTYTTLTTTLGVIAPDGPPVDAAPIPENTSRDIWARVTFISDTYEYSDVDPTYSRYLGQSEGAAIGAGVQFSVASGDGNVWPAVPETLSTDANGYALVTLTMGAGDTIIHADSSYLDATGYSDCTYSPAPFEFAYAENNLSLSLDADMDNVTAHVSLETWTYYTDGTTVKLWSYSNDPAGSATVSFQSGGSAGLRESPDLTSAPVWELAAQTGVDGLASVPYACGIGSPSTVTAIVWFLEYSATATLTVDSDGDGYSDALEAVFGTDSNDAASHPAPPAIQFVNPADGMPVAALPDGTIPLPDGIVGNPYEAGLSCLGNIGTVTWSATGLPDGLNIDTNTGFISGYPTITGSSPVTVTATYYYPSCYYPATRSQQFTLVIYDPLVITKESLRIGIVNFDYSDHMEATGGNGTTSYAWECPDLPAGLEMSPDGTIFGTPTAPGGTTTIHVTVSDDRSQSASTELTIVIANPTVTIKAWAPGTIAQPGALIEGDTALLQPDTDNDNDPNTTQDPPPKDSDQNTIGANDDDIVKIEVVLFKDGTDGSFMLNVPGGIRVFDLNGNPLSDFNLDISEQPITLFVEGLGGFKNGELSATYTVDMRVCSQDGAGSNAAPQNQLPTITIWGRIKFASVFFWELTPNSGFDRTTGTPWLMVPQGGMHWAKVFFSAANISLSIQPMPSQETVSPETINISSETITVTGAHLGENSAVVAGTPADPAMTGTLKLTVKPYRIHEVVIYSVTQDSPGAVVPTAPTAADLEAYLNKVFGLQSNVWFHVTDGGRLKFDYDKGGDPFATKKSRPNGKLDCIGSMDTTLTTEEEKILFSKTSPNAINIFYVADTAVYGWDYKTKAYKLLGGNASCARPGKAIFVNDKTTQKLAVTTHEVGHELGLTHYLSNNNLFTPVGLNNIMSDVGMITDWNLVKEQWDIINRSPSN